MQELWTNVNDLRKTISVQKLETLREMEIQIAVQNRMFSSLESRVSRIEETTHSISEDRYKTLKAGNSNYNGRVNVRYTGIGFFVITQPMIVPIYSF